MRRYAVVILALVVVAMCFGCASRAPTGGALIADRKKELRNALRRYSEAVRNDNVSGVMGMISPEVREPRKRALRNRVLNVLWLREYTGYRVRTGLTFSEVNPRQLSQSRSRIEVAGCNSDGVTFRDSLDLVWDGGKWMITDLSLTKPKPGEVLDLPNEEAERITSVIRPLMRALEKGKVGKIMTILPDTRAALKRRGDPGWLAGWLGVQGKTYTLINDLERVRQFSFPDWPEAEERPMFAYVGPDTVMALYDIPYIWQQGGIYDDTLRVEILLSSVRKKWQIQLLRLYGRGIPGTE